MAQVKRKQLGRLNREQMARAALVTRRSAWRVCTAWDMIARGRRLLQQ
uniref:Uncharacterized protein n=1 Tax=Cucumis melo TaxID=3656 RepID=A0A9I9D1E1_CUCME